MYKNFKLTESEKEQILNMHKSHGYGQPLNEQSPQLTQQDYKEIANRDRFILPLEKDISFFTNIIDESVKFFV